MAHLELLNAAGVAYGLAFALFAVFLCSPRSKLDAIPPWALRLAWALHAAAIAHRWAAEGWKHPPWTTLYEVLSLLAWSMATASVFVDVRLRSRWAGLMASLSAFVAVMLAAMVPGKSPELLQPALQSPWLLVHVPSAVLAYGFFAASAFLAVFYLLRDGVKTERLLLGASALVLATLPWISGAAQGRDDFAARGASELAAACLGLFALQLAVGVGVEAFAPPPTKRGAPRAWFVGSEGEILSWPLIAVRWIFVAAAIALFALLGLLVRANWWEPGFKLRLVPFRFAALVWLAGTALAAMLLLPCRARVEEKLAPAPRIDRWAYQAVLAGFPLLTVSLVSGSIWAYFAWGRYWGWDPKETWALGTWVVYAIYLHLKARPDHTERRAAYVAIAGFFVALFTFLGVSLLFPGTHMLAFAPG